MSNIISKQEPIGQYCLEFNEKNLSPHCVVQVEAFLDDTIYARCASSGIWIQFELPKRTLGDTVLQESDYLLIQQKEIGKSTQLVKIKDIDQTKKWKTGENYLPNLVNSVIIKPYLVQAK